MNTQILIAGTRHTFNGSTKGINLLSLFLKSKLRLERFHYTNEPPRQKLETVKPCKIKETVSGKSCSE